MLFCAWFIAVQSTAQDFSVQYICHLQVQAENLANPKKSLVQLEFKNFLQERFFYVEAEEFFFKAQPSPLVTLLSISNF